MSKLDCSKEEGRNAFISGCSRNMQAKLTQTNAYKKKNNDNKVKSE